MRRSTMAMFNEAEQFLLQNWADAHLLENAMDQVRTKYAALIDEVIETFRTSHPEFSNGDTRYLRNYGDVGIGKPSWLSERWTSGFWIGDLRLDNLISQDEP